MMLQKSIRNLRVSYFEQQPFHSNTYINLQTEIHAIVEPLNFHNDQAYVLFLKSSVFHMPKPIHDKSQCFTFSQSGVL